MQKPMLLKTRALTKKVLQRTSEDYFWDIFLGRLSVRIESAVMKSTHSLFNNNNNIDSGHLHITAWMIFCHLLNSNIFQVVCCFSENNIFLFHISMFFSALPAKGEQQIKPSSLNKTFGSVISKVLRHNCSTSLCSRDCLCFVDDNTPKEEVQNVDSI